MNTRAATELASERWRPTPVVAGTMGVHCLAGASALFGPEAWPWALGALAGNHAVLATIALTPRSSMFGPNLTRLPPEAIARAEIALTFDDGPDPEVTPRVLAILAEHGARATFFCIAARAMRHPELCREIVRRGHSIENHSRSHPVTFAFHGLGGLRREIVAAQALIATLASRAPRFFRPPAGFRSPLLDPVLHGLGLKLVTWTRRGFDTRLHNADFVAARLMAGLGAGDILVLHDGHAARGPDNAPVAVKVLPRLLERAKALGLRPVTLDHAIHA